MTNIDLINNPPRPKAGDKRGAPIDHGPQHRACLEVDQVAAMMKQLIMGKAPMPKNFGCLQGQALAVVVGEIWTRQGGHIHCIIGEDNAPRLVLTEGPPPQNGKAILTGSGQAFIY